MAVEIPPANHWTGTPVIVYTMQDVAKDNRAWTIYQSLNPRQKENFRVALDLHIVVPYARVLEVSRPNAVATAPAPVTPRPESIVGYIKSASGFKGWLVRQAALVSTTTALAFHFKDAYVLGDGTVSVPIVIFRDNLEHPRTQFVFHYHPGAKGARVGHGYASQGHFKPYDGAPKYVRVEKHECTGGLATLWRDAKALARK